MTDDVATEAMRCLNEGQYERGRDLAHRRIDELEAEVARLKPIARELSQRAYEEDHVRRFGF